jgi:hypothetical protein
MPPYVAKWRFIDSVNDKNDVPRGIPVHGDEETEPLISQLVISRTRYCAELPPLLGRDIHPRKGQIFHNSCLTAETFPNESIERLGSLEANDVKRQSFEWPYGEGVS